MEKLHFYDAPIFFVSMRKVLTRDGFLRTFQKTSSSDKLMDIEEKAKHKLLSR